jgi:hypothetical protein
MPIPLMSFCMLTVARPVEQMGAASGRGKWALRLRHAVAVPCCFQVWCAGSDDTENCYVTYGVTYKCRLGQLSLNW